MAARLTIFVLTGWVLHATPGLETSDGSLGTPVCGDISTDVTWTLVESPYVVCGTYVPTVAQGVTLTIEPGVQVQFEANGRLSVAGTLTAIGSATKPDYLYWRNPVTWFVAGSDDRRQSGSPEYSLRIELRHRRVRRN